MKSITFLRNSWLIAACLFGAQFALPQLTTLSAQSLAPQSHASNRGRHPNILFVIMDDVGIDQLKSFNPSALQITPVMNTLSQQGVSFNNCWMMPECSPSRACMCRD